MKRLVGILITTSFFLNILLPTSAGALSFNPNNIISDYDFFNTDDLSLKEIQRFLERRNSALATYTAFDKDGQLRSAAEIIHRASQTHGINPKVLLTLLQKEQSLIEKSRPSQYGLDWATGYAVCDGCSLSDPRVTAFKGFATQVDRAAWQKKKYAESPQSFTYRAGKTGRVDGMTVTPANAATAALYNYTPHISGNQSFWKIWMRFFGKQFPDGTVVKDADTDTLWLIANGARKKFASVGAFLSRYALGQLIIASPSDLDAYPIAGEIRFHQYSLLQAPNGAVFLYADDMKYGIVSKEVFRSLGYNPAEIIRVSHGELDALETGGVIMSANASPAGELIQNKKTGAVWHRIGDAVHPILERAVLRTRFAHQKIRPASPDEITSRILAEPVVFPDGTLITEPGNPAVYIISNGERRPFLSEEAFLALGYSWSQVIPTTGKTLNLHPLGESIDIGRTLYGDAESPIAAASADETPNR